MITDSLFIRLVDHRISTALILFLLLLLLDNQKKRPGFGVRAAGAMLVMCGVNWLMRFVIDEKLTGLIGQGVGYSLMIGIMSLCYLACYAFCYHTAIGELVYVDLLALTMYKLAWNTFKAFGHVGALAGIPSAWSRYSILGSLVSYGVYGAMCVVSYLLLRFFIRRLPSDLPGKSMVVSAVGFIGCQMILEYCGHVFTGDSQALFLYYFCALMYTATNYIVLLVIAKLVRYRNDNEDMQAFITNKMQYYQMSREGIASLQVKCHDLKHQIAAIRSRVGKESFDKYMDRLENSIIEYGTVVECGNEAINVVLTEKNILCSTCGVKFSYIIDGTLFDFMTEMETYSLFGNALGNALESCGKVHDPKKRMISLKAVTHQDMVVLHVENFYEAEPTMVNGMPVTTKDGAGHGFGLRSIQEIAEKYGGVTSVRAENHIFKLTVLMRPAQG